MKNNEKKNEAIRTFIEFNPDVANHLIHLGYKIVGIGRNNKDPKKSVFFFESEEGLDEMSKALNIKMKNDLRKNQINTSEEVKEGSDVKE